MLRLPAILATVALAVLAGCEQPRTQLMIGVVTDIKAPNLIDGAQLVVTRAKDGFVEQQVSWDISGVPNQPFNLPGSYGIYSDGDEIQLDIVLTGLKNGSPVLDRRAVLNLVEGKTLFFRMSLTGGCVGKEDCLDTQSCVEGICRDVVVNPLQLPDFEPEIVSELTCNSGIAYIDTSTGAALPLSEDADLCPGNLCLEGTCLKPPPEEEGTRTVIGTQFTTFVQPTKVTNLPTDLTALNPRALIPQPDGTFTTIAGRGNTDGTFVIEEVPKGPYYLNVGTQYYVTNSSSFDLTSAVQRRPTAVVPTQPTTINLQNVTGLDPWTDADELEAFAPDSDTWWFDLETTGVGGPIAPGTTALTNYAFTIQDAINCCGSGHLIGDGITAEPLFVLQLAGRTSAGGPYKAASKIFQPPPVLQTDGATTNLTGAFTAIPQTNMTSAVFPTTAWDAALGWNGTHFTALHPNATDAQALFGTVYFLVVHGQVGGALYGRIGATADYLTANIPHGPDVSLSDMQFGIPSLPGTWATIVDIGASAFVTLQLPGTTTPARLFGGMSASTLYSAVSNAFYAPQLGPVRGPRVDGHDLFGTPGSGISTTPTITWQAPAIGKPVKYTVVIHQLVVNNTATRRQVVATLHTTDTSVVVPPGVLMTGQFYALQIRASAGVNPDAPFRNRFPGATSTIVTSMFQPTVQGGTGDTDPGGGSAPTVDAGTGGGGN